MGTSGPKHNDLLLTDLIEGILHVIAISTMGSLNRESTYHGVLHRGIHALAVLRDPDLDSIIDGPLHGYQDVDERGRRWTHFGGMKRMTNKLEASLRATISTSDNSGEVEKTIEYGTDPDSAIAARVVNSRW